MTPANLWTVDEAAEALRVKPRTIRSWVYRGTLPYYKIGRLVKIDRRDIEQVFKSSRRGKEIRRQAAATDGELKQTLSEIRNGLAGILQVNPEEEDKQKGEAQ